jgi:hypothetical protein
MFVRLSPAAKIDYVAIDDVAAEVIREAARRILADATGKVTCAAESASTARQCPPRATAAPSCGNYHVNFWFHVNFRLV